MEKGYKADLVILDPPRKGADKAALSAIAKSGAQKIVYISCHPATQARDINILKNYGYIPVKAVPVDMFCYTAGVETVALYPTKRSRRLFTLSMNLKIMS